MHIGRGIRRVLYLDHVVRARQIETLRIKSLSNSLMHLIELFMSGVRKYL
jgi:hypothetical protein